MTAATVAEIKKLLYTAEPPNLGMAGREGALSEAVLNAKLETLLSGSSLSSPRLRAIRALFLLWHDHMDAAHTLAQGVENADGSFVHAMLHRREPDYWNSKYWWRRTGAHPAFPEIARRVGGLLQELGERELATELLPDGRWDPFAFTDACERAASGGDATRTECLRAIQRVEAAALLDCFCHE